MKDTPPVAYWSDEQIDSYVDFVKNQDRSLWDAYLREELEHGDTTGLTHDTGIGMRNLVREFCRGKGFPVKPEMLFVALRCRISCAK